MTDQSNDRFLALKAVMMPRDTNPYGTIFGGVILSYIDQAGAVGARHEIHKNGWPAKSIVTVAMDRVEFHEPVHVGDVVSFYTQLKNIGTTSITMHVTVETHREFEPVKLTQANVSYVAVKQDGQVRQPVALRD